MGYWRIMRASARCKNATNTPDETDVGGSPKFNT
jgi:hypothetical protein